MLIILKVIKPCILLAFSILIIGCSSSPETHLPSNIELTSDANSTLLQYQTSDKTGHHKPLSVNNVISLAVFNNIDLIKQQTELALSQQDVKNLMWVNGLDLTADRNSDSKTNTVDEEKSIVSRFDTLSLGSAYYDASLQKIDSKMRQELIFQNAQLTAIEAIQLYYELAAHQAMENKITAMMPQLQDAKRIYVELLSNQLSDTLSILGAALELGEIESSLMDTQRTTYELRDRFRKLVGQTGYASVQLDLTEVDTQSLLPQTPQLHQLNAVMLATRYEVLVSYLEEEQAKQTYKKSLLSWLPSFSIGFGKDFNEAEPDYDTWRINWNLLNIFKLANAEEVYELRKTLIQLSRDNAILNLHQDLTTLSEITSHNKLSFSLKKQNSHLSQRAFEALRNQSEFNAGRLVLLKSQLNTIESEFKRDMALAIYMTSMARLKYAAGIPMVPRNWMELDFNTLEQEVDKWTTWDWSAE